MEKTIVKVIYTAMVLDTDKIISKIEARYLHLDEYANRFLHHVTVQFGFSSTELPDYIGEYVEFSIDDVRRDVNAVSFHGHFSSCSDNAVLRELQASVKHPHITIVTADGIKPVYAGTMTEDKIIVTFQNRAVHGRLGAFVVYDDGTTGWVFEKPISYKDMSDQWWLLTAHHHQIMFYGCDAKPTEHHVANSTGVIDAKLNEDGLWLKTESGSVYLVKWEKHIVALTNLIIDKGYINSLGVVFPGDEF